MAAAGGRSLEVQGQPSIYSEFQASQGSKCYWLMMEKTDPGLWGYLEPGTQNFSSYRILSYENPDTAVVSMGAALLYPTHLF